MQCYTIFFIIVNTLRVSGGFSAHHQELKNCTNNIGYKPSLLAATASGSSKQAWHIPDAVCTVLEPLTMGEETARNAYSIDSNKESCITLHLVGYTRVGTLIVATIYLQLIQNTSRYLFRSFTVLQCSHQHCVQPVASDVEVVGYL